MTEKIELYRNKKTNEQVQITHRNYEGWAGCEVVRFINLEGLSNVLRSKEFEKKYEKEKKE